jgi:large subunit ribosomal protein L1
LKICVIAAPGSKAAAEATAAGATLVGEDEIFNQVKEGIVDFDRCICHTDSLQKLNKAGLGRVLGPRGLMPSAKTGTVVNQIGATVRNMVGGSEYRERVGVVRMAIGQLGFSPEQMQNNITAFMDAVKKDMGQMSDRITKEIHEVVSCVCLI